MAAMRPPIAAGPMARASNPLNASESRKTSCAKLYGATSTRKITAAATESLVYLDMSLLGGRIADFRLLCSEIRNSKLEIREPPKRAAPNLGKASVDFRISSFDSFNRQSAIKQVTASELPPVWRQAS